MSYTLLGRSDVPDFEGEGRHYIHDQTGAELFHLANDDRENFFSFAFATLPQDSTGVAHILEHTVLTGSERFPVKDPFLQLYKGSVHTFLNAMTYPDKTVYPGASPVADDLINMLRVYGDAVFFPRLLPALFRQEGHRLEFDGAGDLIRTGIVYNEMKGSYSNHDNIVFDASMQTLFPDTLYRFDSGGDPAVIGQLSYDDFVAFHRSFYHPANCRIVLYGNIETQRYLDLLETEYLGRFGAGQRAPAPTLQPRWDAPRQFEWTYPIEGETSARTTHSVNWLLTPITDRDAVLEQEVLADILVGHSGAPLAKALVDSGLGEDLSPVVGIELDLAQSVFSVGLRGSEPERAAQVQQLTLDTLEGLVRDGLSPEGIEAALRRFEFSGRELRSGPRGMRVMGRALRSWMHGGQPTDRLHFNRDVERLRARLAEHPRLFEERIKADLIANPHRSLVTVRPDPDQLQRDAARVSAELQTIRSDMSEQQVDQVRAESDELIRLQQTPDSLEDVATIPRLGLEDIPREIVTIARESTASAAIGGAVLLHGGATNEISYVDLAFDLPQLTAREERLFSLLNDSVTELGIGDLPAHELQQRINLSTGGISTAQTNMARYDKPGLIRRAFVVRVKALDRAWPEAAQLLELILGKADFSDTERLVQVADELRVGIRSALIPSGNYFASLRAGLGVSGLAVLEENSNGWSQYEFLAGERAEATGAELEALFTRILRPEALSVNITASQAQQQAILGWLPALSDVLCARPHFAERVPSYPDPAGFVVPPDAQRPTHEFLLSSATVNYAAASFQAYGFADPQLAAQEVLAHVLSTGLLWEKIRMTGGAYGAFAGSRADVGTFSFASYRDPHSAQTLKAYAAALEELAAQRLDTAALEAAKVALAGRELRPLAARDAGFLDFRRALVGVDDEYRQGLRDRMRAVTVDSLRDCAADLRARFDSASVAVLGGADGKAEMIAAYPQTQITELGV